MESAGITVASAVSDVGTVLNSAITTIASNPILLVFIGMAIISAGALLFKRLRRSSK